MTKDINSETRTNNFMSPGIHENVELRNLEEGKSPIVYSESSKGNKFATIHFVNEKGEVLVHTEFEPSGDNQEIVENKTLNQMKRFKHILTKIVPEEDTIFEVDNFESYIKKCVEVIGNKYKGLKFRLKVTLNNKGYTSLPNYVPFLETMDIEKSKSRLSINTAMDKMVREKADVEVNSNVNPFATSTEGYVADEEILQSTIYNDSSTVNGEMPF